ncbi:hypothetical protein ECH7EC4206_B0001 [Escherichia coli O157:H7 str. EC4206]|nr:hypothetical protein ECH7EC4206_B0001 [Escherichia coli O157:H7 str. EC4206]
MSAWCCGSLRQRPGICGRKCSMVMERMTIPCRWWRKPAVTWKRM